MKSHRQVKLVKAFVLGVMLTMLFPLVAAGESTPYTELPSLRQGQSLPEDVAVSSSGKVYVVDASRGGVFVYDSAGRMSGKLSVYYPTSVAVAADGTVYVATSAELALKVFSAAGNPIGTIGAGEFKMPRNIAVDSLTGDIYVVDQIANSIKIYGSNGSAKTQIANLHLPQDVAIYGDNLFIIDQPFIKDPYQHAESTSIRGAQVLVLDKNNPVVNEQTPHFGQYGNLPGQFISPKGITVDANYIYVSDSFHGAIFRFTHAGGYVDAIQDSDGGIQSLSGLAISKDSLLYVTSSFEGETNVFGIPEPDGTEPWVNTPPVAVASADPTTVDEFADVSLNGSGSTDPDLETLTYSWQQLNGPAVTLVNSNSAQPSFKAPSVGPEGTVLSFQLVVTDERGMASNPAVCNVAVTNVVSGSLTINNEDSYTNSVWVTLAPESLDAAQMNFSNDGINFSDLENYSASRTWQLADGDGVKTVTAKFNDGQGHIATVSASIILDTAKPAVPAGMTFADSTVSWVGVADPDANYYVIEYSLSPDFKDASTIEPVTLTNYSFAGLGSGTWYWRVKSVDNAGNSSDWSATQVFAIGGSGSGCISIPDAPELVNYDEPVDANAVDLETGAFNDPKGCSTHWKTQWQVSTTEDFAELVFEGGKVNEDLTSYPVPALVLDPAASYFWRARFWSESGTRSTWSATGRFTTTPQVDDEDGNNVPDDQDVEEDLDLDKNGVFDRHQERLKAVRAARGTGRIAVRLATDDEVGRYAVRSAQAVDPDTILEIVGRPAYLPMGLVNFRVQVKEPGETIDVRVIFSEPVPAGASWVKYDPTNGWKDYSANTVWNDAMTEVVVTLTDGGAGDADGVANGWIIDPSGPAAAAPADAAPASSENGGSCFIATAAVENGMAGFGSVAALVIGLGLALVARFGSSKKTRK